MVVMGDVLMIVAVIFGVCLSAWALVLGMALMFPTRAAHAESATSRSPWKTFFIGLFVMGIGFLISSAFLQNPLPGAKFFGFVLLMALLSVAMLGMTGLAKFVGQRMAPLEPDISKYKALARGTGLLVVAGVLPLLGWFVFAPLLLMFCTGAGLSALMARAPIQPAFDLGAA